MLINTSVTIYHKGRNEETLFETWTRYNYKNAWFAGGKGARLNKGYENANDVDVRIPYDENENLKVENFAVGDIIVKGTLTQDITKQQDLTGTIYNITSIKDNDYGYNQHIHIGGK